MWVVKDVTGLNADRHVMGTTVTSQIQSEN